MKNIAISKNLEKKLENIAERTGLSREDLFMNAVVYYYETLRKKIDLKKELEAWEVASDRDLMRLGKSLS